MKYWAYVMVGLLLTSGALATKPALAQDDWYPGEGVEQGLLVKYKVATFDQKRGQPFDATIWFESKDDKGNWNTFVIIEDAGEVTTSDMTLSSLNLAATGFDISEEFRPYRAAIKDSLGWLASYASRIEPKSLTGGTWGIIAAIGGGGIIVSPTGSESLQLANQSWDTTIIGFHYGVDSAIWVTDNFPLPVKAKVFALTTQHPIPVQFEFELLEMTVTDQRPIPPETELKVPTPPLSKMTTSGLFFIDLYWKPETIEPGKPVTFGVVILDGQGNLVKDPQYDMLITDAGGKTVADIKKSLGEETHEVTFESSGKAHVRTTYLGSLASPSEERIIERADFDLVVVPSEKPEVPPTLVEEKQIDVSVAMKQTKRLTLIAVKNNDEVPIYGLQIKLTDGDVRFVKARGWDRERIDQSTVAVNTLDKPLLPGRSQIVLLLGTNPASSMEWVVLDQIGERLGNGVTEPRIR